MNNERENGLESDHSPGPAYSQEIISPPQLMQLSGDAGTKLLWEWYLNREPLQAGEIARILAQLEPGRKHAALFESWVEVWNRAKARNDAGIEPQVIALQLATAQEFGVQVPYLQRERSFPSVVRAFETYAGRMRAFVRAMHHFTQGELAARGISGAVMWRGLKPYGKGYPFPYPDGFYEASLSNNPLSSWTLSLKQAQRFALGKTVALNCAYIPATRLIGTPFTGFGVIGQLEALSLSSSSPFGDSCHWLVWCDSLEFGSENSVTLADWISFVNRLENDHTL